MGALQPFSLDKFIDTIVKNLAFCRILNFQMLKDKKLKLKLFFINK